MFTPDGKDPTLLPTTSAHQPFAEDDTLISLNMPVMVRADNVLTYSLLGSPYPIFVIENSNRTNTVITPTQTRLTSEVGPMQFKFNLTSLNSIEPDDCVNQSIPFSYMSLTAISLDGLDHSVQIYSGLSAEWLSADRGQVIE